MNPIDILTRPLNLNPKLFDPVGAGPKIPAAAPISLPKTSPISIISRPLPSSVSSLVQKAAPANQTMIPKLSVKPSPLKALAAPLPTPIIELARKTAAAAPDHTVRRQDFKDLGNLPFELIFKPVINAVLSLNEVRTGKPSGKFGAPFPHMVSKTDGDYTRPVPLEEGAMGTRRFYEDLVKEGVPEDQAYKAAIVKTVGDMSVLVPIFRDASKFALLKTAPEKLINTELVNETSATITKSQMRDYLSGRTPAFEMPDELRKTISQVLKSGTREDKIKLMDGVVGTQTLTVKPSRLGEIFGVSQEEANMLLDELYGGATRQAPSGALPGYREVPGQPAPMGLSMRKVEKVGSGDKAVDKAFDGFEDLSSNVLAKLEGRKSVSKQFISDLTNSPDLKQAERDTIRTLLKDEGDVVDVPAFANKVKSELLPLKRDNFTSGTSYRNTQYESITLPSEIRGPIKGYSEHIYQSPIKTSAGDVHFRNDAGMADNYFAHTRIEDVAENGSPELARKQLAINPEAASTRRVIEIQSDLFQKENLENEYVKAPVKASSDMSPKQQKEYLDFMQKREAETKGRIAKLEPYRNTWHERVIREEVKQAAVDSKTKLQFPTGETAMKIEGLGQAENRWRLVEKDTVDRELRPEDLKTGQLAWDGNVDWVITDVLGDGKFKAVPKREWDEIQSIKKSRGLKGADDVENRLNRFEESFDISGKVDTNNPIYRFYEKEVGRYLTNKYGAKQITDAQGVKWWEVNVDPKAAGEPVSAFKKGEDFKPNITKEEATKIVRSLFSEAELDLVFDPKLDKKGYLGVFNSSGTGSFGQRLKPMITLLEKNGMVEDKTLYHEAFHAHFNTHLTSSERQLAIQKVKKNFLTISRELKTDYATANERAEEWLADDFADYVKSGKSKGSFGGLWERLLQKLRDFIRRAEKFKDIYDDILKGTKKKGEPANVERARQGRDHSVSDDSEDALSAKREEIIKQNPEQKLINWREEANQELTAAEINLALKAKAIQDLKNRGLSAEKEKLELLKLERQFAEEAAADSPGKALMKYRSRATGSLPEVTGKDTRLSLKGDRKIVKNSLWGIKGDDLAKNMHGFEDLDQAEKALQQYIKQRDRVASIKKDLREKVEDFTSKKAIIDAVRKEIQAETEGRINKVRVIQDFFKLTDIEMSKIMGFKGMRNISMMTNAQFGNFMKKMEGTAAANFILNQERLKVEATIWEKELVKVDNLRQAMKLPEIRNMKASQLREFGAILDTFEKGDEFLGVRMLETVKNTKLGTIKTVREAREKFLEEAGAQPADIGRIIDRGSTDFDDIKAASLQDATPFHKLVYEEMIRVFLDRDMKLVQLEQAIFPLTNLARKSRARGVSGRLVPTDQKIWEWLNETDAGKIASASGMTAEELSAGSFMRDWLSLARDYLFQKQVLKGTRFYNNYISHVQRDFLEAFKEDGLMAAFKEMKTRRAMVEANFEILSGKESEILPLEKFFRYSQRRPDDLNPSKNVAKVFMQYARAFYTKQALDEIVPKLVIYAHTLTPKRMTPRGLEYNDTLKRWLNAYINSQKGRPPAVMGNLIKPGGRVDWALRTGVAFTRLLDLGFNLAVQIASPIGEQASILPGLRARQVVGLRRLLTPKGRRISKKYENFVGKSIVETMKNPTTNIGEKGLAAVFGGFSIGARKAAQVWLLSSMTKEEWVAGEISPKRLSQMKARMSRYRAVEKSILGTTALGQVATQYRSWAIPIFSRNIGNLARLTKMVRSSAWKKAGKSEEFTDLFASVVTTTAIALAVYNLYASLRDEKDRTFLEEIAFKAARESMTVIGAMDPSLYTSSPRLLAFLSDLSTSIGSLAMAAVVGGQRNKTGENKGELKGKVKLQKTLTPKAFKQIGELFSGGGLKNNKLQGIKLKPKEGTKIDLKGSKINLSGIKLVPKEKIKLQ